MFHEILERAQVHQRRDLVDEIFIFKVFDQFGDALRLHGLQFLPNLELKHLLLRVALFLKLTEDLDSHSLVSHLMRTLYDR